MPNVHAAKHSLVVLSGGQDSTTVMAMARAHADACIGAAALHAVTFDYGQRHRRELACAEKVAALAGAQWHLIDLTCLGAIGNSALLDPNAKLGVAHSGNAGLPSSFVPGRNLLFLTTAAALAYKLNCANIWTGVSEQDYSGYPDCRAATLSMLEQTLRLGLDWQDLRLRMPLLGMPKVSEVMYMAAAGRLGWYKHTHTCYAGAFPPCGVCDACKLRAQSFAQAGIPDPLLELA